MINDIKAGKYISFLLRHHPEAAGLTLDHSGYADTKLLIEAVAKEYNGFSMDDLERIVRENNKRRYAFNDDKTMIRASQGHSVSGVDLGLTAKQPPDVLYHGTGERSLEKIRAEGIKKMTRQYVHLSPDEETAVNVGKRHGNPAVIRIDAAAMSRGGYEFYLSENGVWLTDYVPPEYFI